MLTDTHEGCEVHTLGRGSADKFSQQQRAQKVQGCLRRHAVSLHPGCPEGRHTRTCSTGVRPWRHWGPAGPGCAPGPAPAGLPVGRVPGRAAGAWATRTPGLSQSLDQRQTTRPRSCSELCCAGCVRLPAPQAAAAGWHLQRQPVPQGFLVAPLRGLAAALRWPAAPVLRVPGGAPPGGRRRGAQQGHAAAGHGSCEGARSGGVQRATH